MQFSRDQKLSIQLNSIALLSFLYEKNKKYFDDLELAGIEWLCYLKHL